MDMGLIHRIAFNSGTQEFYSKDKQAKKREKEEKDGHLEEMYEADQREFDEVNTFFYTTECWLSHRHII